MTDANSKRKLLLRTALSALRAAEELLEAELEQDATPVTQAEDLVPLLKCGVPVRTARRAIKLGELPASLVGREYLLRRADLAKWLDGRRVQPRPAAEREQSPAERAIDRARRSGALRVVGGAS